jgi:tetratricopeptide (TPR) repeat protein
MNEESMPSIPKSAAAAFIFFFGTSAHAQTLPDGWPWRRPVSFKQSISKAPGENVVWVEFYTNAQRKPDASDIRVTTADRTILPLKVMQSAADNDLVRIAFATKGEGPYFVWWGNPQAKAPEHELQIHRGVLLEIMNNTAASPSTQPAAPPLPTTSPALAEPRTLASFLLPTLAIGYRPFSEEHQLSFHYSAMFQIDQSITPKMQLSLSGTGNMSLDNKNIRDVTRRPVPVVLTAGWHALDIWQNNPGASVSVALSWQRPGDKTLMPFPSTLFAPAARGIAGNLQKDQKPAADISPEAMAEVQLAPGTFAPRYVFEAAIPENMKPTILWSFGDGQTSTGLIKASHIFLSPGVYPVTLKLQPQSGAAQDAIVRIAVKDRLFDRLAHPPLDPLPTVRSILKDYKLEQLRADDAFRGMQFYESAKDDVSHIAWGRAWLTGHESTMIPADGVVSAEAFAIARLQSQRKEYKETAETFKLAAAKPIGMQTRTNLIRHEIMTLCDEVEDVPQALQEANKWVARVEKTNPLEIRTIQVALAYALIAAGDGQNAKVAIDKVMPPPPASAPADAKNPWRSKVEESIGKKDFDGAAALIDQAELTDPLSLWTGATQIPRVTLLAAQGKYLEAARIAAAHVRANPTGPYAAELLFHAAENYKLGGAPQKAQSALDQLQSGYPESPFIQRILPK